MIYYQTVNYLIYEPYNQYYYKILNKNFLLANYLISPKGARKILNNIIPFNPNKQIDSYIVDLTNNKIINAYVFKLPTLYAIQDYTKSDVQSNKKLLKTHDFHSTLNNND